MIRSGKNPRHKDNNDETKQDIISNLPYSLLIDILSLLRESDVKQTRFVSKRWRNLFAFRPNIRFLIKSYPSLEQVKNFHVFVDRTLAIRGDMPIEKLVFKCQKKCDYDCFYDILCTLVRFKAGGRELELRFPVILKDRYKVSNFCWDLSKTWDSLVGLTLDGGFVLDVPNDDELLFPCLKKISLIFIEYASEESVVNLISGCPVLETLYVVRALFDDRLEVFNISSLSLKRLRISFNSFSMDYKVVIDAPKLEYICITDYLTNHYSLKKPLSLLVEADIRHSPRVISQLVPFLSSAKKLNLNIRSTDVPDHVHGLNMPVFPNLVRLVIGSGLDFLPVWLNNMPNLEHITLSYWHRLLIVERNLPKEPPVCLHFKMKEIVVHNDRFVTQEEFTFMRYILEHSIILEKLTFSARIIDPERRDQLLNFHRGSERCQIEFV